jgi:hypothetical protein
MGQATGTTDTLDLVGLAEDVEDVIFNISPGETPLLTMLNKRSKDVTATLHQWQTDSLAAAAANRQIEGDDSTYATVTPTTMLSNYAQIAKKTVMISGTADAVRKYGRKKEFAYQIAKKGKELKRDIEYALARNQASSAGGNATARSSAGLESMISGNSIEENGTGTTPGYAAGVWAAPTDGTSTAMTEGTLVLGIEAAWTDGGDASTIMTNSTLKKKIATFAGANAYAGFYNPNQGKAQGVVIGGVDGYISDFGEHKIVLNRHMRATVMFGIDPDYVSVGWLRNIKFEERAKTGDATRGELIGEFALICDNPDAHFKLADYT